MRGRGDFNRTRQGLGKTGLFGSGSMGQLLRESAFRTVDQFLQDDRRLIEIREVIHPFAAPFDLANGLRAA